MSNQFQNFFSFGDNVRKQQPETAYQKILKQYPGEEKWYQGDAPTAREIYGQIGTLFKSGNDTDKARAFGLAGNLNKLQSTPGSQYYNPYTQPTNKAVNELGKMGVDVSRIDDGWYNKNSYLQQYYLNTGTTNEATKPGKNASQAEWAGYHFRQIDKDREITQKAQDEWKAAQEEIQWMVNDPNRNWTDDEIADEIRNGVTGGKYSTLNKMDEGRKAGVPLELNSAIGYSDDAIYGEIWAARNQNPDGTYGTGDFETNIILSAMGQGNQYVENPEIRAKLNPKDPAYSPYSLGSTAQELCLYFGVYSLDRKYLESIRDEVEASGDPTKIQNYNAAWDVMENTEELDNQLTAMNSQIDRLMKKGNYTPDEIIKAIYGNDEYSGLFELDATMDSKTGKITDLVPTAWAVDYKRADIENKIREQYAEKHKADVDYLVGMANTFNSKVIGPGAALAQENATAPQAENTITEQPENSAGTAPETPGPKQPAVTINPEEIELHNENRGNSAPMVDKYGTQAEKNAMFGAVAGSDLLKVVQAQQGPLAKPDDPRRNSYLRTVGERVISSSEVTIYNNQRAVTQSVQMQTEIDDLTVQGQQQRQDANNAFNALVQSTGVTDEAEIVAMKTALDGINGDFLAEYNGRSRLGPVDGAVFYNLKDTVDYVMQDPDYSEFLAESYPQYLAAVHYFEDGTEDFSPEPGTDILWDKYQEWVANGSDRTELILNEEDLANPEVQKALANAKAIFTILASGDNENTAQEISTYIDNERAANETDSEIQQRQDEIEARKPQVEEYNKAVKNLAAAIGLSESDGSKYDTGAIQTISQIPQIVDTYIPDQPQEYSTYFKKQIDYMKDDGMSNDDARAKVMEEARYDAQNLPKYIEKVEQMVEALEKSGVVFSAEQKENLQCWKEKAEWEAKQAYYYTLADRPDYADTVKKVKEDAANNQYDALAYLLASDWHEALSLIPGNTLRKSIGAIVDESYMGVLGDRMDEVVLTLQNMTEAEKDRYFYLLGKEGKIAGLNFLSDLMNRDKGYMRVRNSEEMKARAAEMSKSDLGTIVGTFGSISTEIVSTPIELYYMADQKLHGRDVDPRSINYIGRSVSQGLQEGAKEQLVKKYGNKEFVEFMYGNVYSALKSLIVGALSTLGLGAVKEVAMAFPKVAAFVEKIANGTGVLGKLANSTFGKGAIKIANEFNHAAAMGLDAMSAAYQEALIRTDDDEKASKIAMVTFLAETVSEAVTIGNIHDMFRAGDEAQKKMVKDAIVDVLKDLGQEALGESSTELIESMADKWIAGADSQWQQTYDMYYEKYNDAAYAKEMADKAMWHEILMAGLGAIVSAGMTDAGSYLAGSAVRTVRQTALGGDIIRMGGKNVITELVQIGKESGDKRIVSVAEKIENGKVSRKRIGKLASELMTSENKNVRNRARGVLGPLMTEEGAGQAARNTQQERAQEAEQQAQQPAEQQEEQETAVPEAEMTESELADIPETDEDDADEEAADRTYWDAKEGWRNQKTNDLALLMSGQNDTTNSGEAAANMTNVLTGTAVPSGVDTAAATAAATTIVNEIADGDSAAAANTVRMLLEESQGSEINDTKKAVAWAALTSGKANKILNNMVRRAKNGAMFTYDDVEALRHAAVSDMTGQDSAKNHETYNNNVQESRKASLVMDRVNSGELNDAVKGEQKAVETAEEAVQNTQEEVDRTTREADASAKNLVAAGEEYVNRPVAGGETETPFQNAMAKHVAAVNQKTQAEQGRQNAQEKLDAAQKDLGDKTNSTLTGFRADATEMVAQQDQQAAVEAAARQAEIEAENARIAELAAQMQAEEDEKSGKTWENNRDELIEKILDNEYLEEGERREQRRAELTERADMIHAGKIDMAGMMNNTEGLLATGIIGRQLGVDVAFTDDPNILPDGAAGKYQNGVVYLNQKMIQDGKMTVGQAVMEIALHEFTHYMEGTKQYAKYSQTVLDFLFQGENADARMRAAIDSKIAEYKEKFGQTLTEDGAKAEIVADFAKNRLNDRDVVQRFIKNGLAGKIRNALHNINQAIKNFRLTGVQRETAEYLRKTERLYQKMIEDAARSAVHPDGGQFSIAQLAEATGLEFNENTLELRTPDGKQVDGVKTKITPKMLNGTPVGMMIDLAENGMKNKKGKDILSPTISKKTANAQRKMFADLANMAAQYRDSDLVWEIASSTMFSAMKSNSDPQYSTTVDFGTICAKTQEIINVMSQVMLEKGRGLTRDEVLKVYNETAKADLTVPCPVCYVFSRWMGVPSLLGQMSEYQKRFVKTNEDGTVNVAETQKAANEYIKSALEKFGSKEGIDDAKTSITNRLKTQEKNRTDALKVIGSETATEAEKAAAKEKHDKAIETMDSLTKDLGEVEAFNWVTQALCEQKRKGKKVYNVLDADGNYVVDKNFELTPDDVLFDLRRTGDFAKFTKNWSYRNTRGAGMGKAIMPYSGETIGDIIYGTNRRMASANPFLTMDPQTAAKGIKDAIARAVKQNLIGGQRLQSTSDFRPEWGLDYMMTFLELQAIGSKVQMYTKVAEAVPLLASMGADINLSIMGKGKGWHIDDNGNYVLDFSDVTGMKYETAKALKDQHSNVQMILVGMNDTHIRLALANSDIDFVIPWHSSGNSKDTLSSLVSSASQSQERLETSSDYTETQSDKASDNQTPEQKKLWDLRMKILQGKKITAEERNTIYTDPYLAPLYDRFNVEGKDPDCYKVKLGKDQAKQIFPYEYWNKSLTKDQADENGRRFVEYCQHFGMTPRFSGTVRTAEEGKYFTAEEVGDGKPIAYDSEGRVTKYEQNNFAGAVYDENGNITGYDPAKMDKGYWKVLIDRPMYDNAGKYRDQQVVDVTQAKIGKIENGKLTGSDMPLTTSAMYGPGYSEQEKTAVDNSLAAINEQEDLRAAQRSGQFSDGGVSLTDVEQAVNDVYEEMSTDELLELLGLSDDEEEDALQIMTNAVQDIKNEFDPTIYHGKLYVKPETMDFWLSGGGFASSSPNYAQAYITTMNPADFLRMTTVTEEGQQRILNEATPLDEEQLASDAKRQPIQLIIDEESGKVVGHEGRHRAVALSRAGVTEMPVLLFDNRTKYDKEAKAEMTLSGQNYGDYENGNELTFYDVIPLSSGNADLIRGRFVASDEERQAAEQNGQRIAQYSDGGASLTDLDQQLVDSGVITQDDLAAYNAATGNGPGLPPGGGTDVGNYTGETGNAQRQFGRKTAQESDALHQEVKDYLYNNSSYTPDSNKAQIDRAVGWVQEKANGNDPDGYQAAVNEVTSDDFDYRSADGQARMLTVMSMAALKGDTATELRIADAYNKQGTDLGRQLQSRKIFRLMTPLGRRMTLQQEVARINQDYINSNKDTRVELPEFILKAAEAAQTEEDFAKVQKEAEKALAAQMPANWKDKLRTWRMVSMLANPRTHIRNILGNWIFKPTVQIKNMIGAGLESAFVKEGGERTKAVRSTKEAKAFAKQDVQAMKDVLTGEAKYSPESKIEQNKKAFGQGKGLLSRTLGRAVQAISDFNSDMLEKEDWIFLNGHYQRALAGYMTANGLTSADMTGDTLEKARTYAVLEAQKATYRDANAVSSWLNEMSRKGGVGGFLVDTVLPFKKTPANILRRGIEYSPVGLIKSLATAKHAVDLYAAWDQNGRKGKMPKGAKSLTEVLDNIASGLTGTAVAGLGALAYALGAVKLGFGGEPDDELEKERGSQEYSVELFGHSFTIDWAAPVCMPFFTGASLYKEISEMGDNIQSAEGAGNLIGKVINSLSGISEPVFNLSMLDGVSSLLKTSSYSNQNELPIFELLQNIGANYVSSFVPSALGAVARTVDTTRRQNYVESGDPLRIWKQKFEAAQNKIPFLSNKNIPYRDVYGNTDTSTPLEAILENFLLPGYLNEIKEDRTIDELQRLADEGFDSGDNNVIPKTAGKKIGDVALNDQQYDQYRTTRGQTAKALLDELVNTDEFAALTGNNPEAQAQMISDVWKYANAVARKEVFPDYDMKSLPNWMKGAYGTGDFIGAMFQNEEKKAKEEYQKQAKADLFTSIDGQDADAIATSVVALRSTGMDDKKIHDMVRDYYRDQYKQAYRDGDEDTMDAIKFGMLYLDLGDQSFTDDELDKKSIFRTWKNDVDKE